MIVTKTRIIKFTSIPQHRLVWGFTLIELPSLPTSPRLRRTRRAGLRRAQAFTLIELLVVIAVIGLLASVILVSLNSARGKARDGRRKADLSQVTRALELYYDTYGGYPTSAWKDGTTATYNVYDSLCLQANFTRFMSGCPHDPKYPNIACYNAEYVYISESFRTPGTLGKRYVLYATLEDQSTTNLDPSSYYDNNMINLWPCPGYGIPNYRVGDLKQ